MPTASYGKPRHSQKVDDFELFEGCYYKNRQGVVPREETRNDGASELLETYRQQDRYYDYDDRSITSVHGTL